MVGKHGKGISAEVSRTLNNIENKMGAPLVQMQNIAGDSEIVSEESKK
jgi:hypothetical protein